MDMSNSVQFSAVPAIGILFLVALGLATFAFWIWMLIDCIRNKGLSDNERIIWVLVIILAHCLGGLIYFFVGRPKGQGGGLG